MAQFVGNGKSSRKGSAEPPISSPVKIPPNTRAKDSRITDTEIYIDQWEARILENSREDYNKIKKLLDLAQRPELDHSAESICALCRVFCHLIAAGEFSNSLELAQHDVVIAQWLAKKLEEFWEAIPGLGHQLGFKEQNQCLKYLMQVIREESLSNSAIRVEVLEKRGRSIFNFLVSASSHYLNDSFVSNYAAKYLDIAYATVYGMKAEMEKASNYACVDLTLRLLQDIQKADLKAFWVSAKEPQLDKVTQKLLEKVLGNCWLIIIGQSLNKNQRKTILRLVPTKIAPLLRKPEKLLDFLVDSFALGDATALLALSGLFHLIQEKNLDYPDFYEKVYSLLDSSILHSKHRSNFLRLLDSFLASSHLPAILIASFLKRLARLCLFAPPAAIAHIVPLIYNLLKAHPMCTFMIHRKPDGLEDDPFDMNENDPMETGALESSLWELHTLQLHYHPNVSIIARIMSEQFTKPAYNLEDFLDHSYASMLAADLTKPITKGPVVEYQIPKTVFPRLKRELTADDDVLEFWTFNG